jgi:hypothetical protein
MHTWQSWTKYLEQSQAAYDASIKHVQESLVMLAEEARLKVRFICALACGTNLNARAADADGRVAHRPVADAPGLVG